MPAPKPAMPPTKPDPSPLAEALAKLEEAMRPHRGRSLDPERRRAAARLAELLRCEDDELAAYAKRHQPGRAVDEAALRAAREMILVLGRVLGPDGSSADVNDVLDDARRALLDRLADAAKTMPPPPNREVLPPADVPPQWLNPAAWPVEPDATFTIIAAAERPFQPALPFGRTLAPPPLLSPDPPVNDADPDTSITLSTEIDRPPSPALPFAPAAPPPLTLHQYAGLVVACELYPSYAESTHALYGVPTPEARAALDAFWSSRFAADPALAERWWELRAAARKYFLQSG